jgi:hypothetical protein
MNANMMLWAGPPGTWMFGVLADGTTFQFLGQTGWRTVVGPQSVEEAIPLVLTMTSMAESSGARMAEEPKEFAMDEEVLVAIRNDKGWDEVGPLLFESVWG